jgi:GNAT superfamily N-acetyltransferase
MSVGGGVDREGRVDDVAGAVPLTGLPPGYVWRPLEKGDLPAVFALEAAGEAFDDGVVEVDLADLEADWRRPDFDARTMSVGVFGEDGLVAYAEVFLGRAEALVRPDHRGLGLGAALARWTWAVARAEGRSRVGQTVSENEHAAETLFRELGYEVTHTSWILRRALDPFDGGDEPPPALPDGFSFREYRPGVDDREVFTVIDDAFQEWRGEGSQSMGFDNWAAHILEDADPDLLVLIQHAGLLAGAAVCRDYGPGAEGWIEQVAVVKAHRNRGLGRALLQECFRRFAQRGRLSCGVNTDSRTGALGLYEHAGMTVDRTYRRWTKTGL